ncbi:MAG TPA: tetratricopeptide repeat protein [Candidatus Binataceae bacterium]|nr:tetratricopeptide repeat protein [Candidatus Binataceae bacterium]
MRDTSSTSTWKTSTALATFLSVLLMAGCGHKSADDYLNAGDLAMQSSGFSQAEADYQQAVKLAPNDPRTHVALANAYVAEKKPDQARAELMKALDLDLKNHAAHAALGDLYLADDEPQAAEEQYRAAVALDPANAAYRIKLAQALTRANKFGPAEVELRTAIGLEPRNAAAHYALASLLFAENNRQDEAQKELATAQSLNPSLASPSPMATPAAAATSAAIRLRPLNKRFQLTKNSPVYQNPDQTSAVVGQVHRGRWVNVTGITGDWLQVRLRNGTLGFIPTAAAE